jgi:pimeloyl-ACP methyl ester carboxylesterase
VAVAGALAGRYHRDLRRARGRLREFERKRAATRHGPVEYCEWGEGSPVLLVHGVVGGCDVPPSWRAPVPSGSRIIAPSRFGYPGSPTPRDASVAAQADVFADLFGALGIERAAVVGFSAGSTSAVQLALRHPSRVTRLVLVAANAPHAKPVMLAPRRLAPVMFSQPVLWALRVFMPTRLARIAGAPADYPLTGADRHTLAAIFDSFFPVAPRRPGAIFDGYVGNPEIAGTHSKRSRRRRWAFRPSTIPLHPTRTRVRWWPAFRTAAGWVSNAAGTSSSTTIGAPSPRSRAFSLQSAIQAAMVK